MAKAGDTDPGKLAGAPARVQGWVAGKLWAGLTVAAINMIACYAYTIRAKD